MPLAININSLVCLTRKSYPAVSRIIPGICLTTTRLIAPSSNGCSKDTAEERRVSPPLEGVWRGITMGIMAVAALPLHDACRPVVGVGSTSLGVDFDPVVSSAGGVDLWDPGPSIVAAESF
jgi:hypothetical protein